MKWGGIGFGLILGSLALAPTAQAIPSLQLGPGSGSWTYDLSTNTWMTTDNPLQLMWRRDNAQARLS